jgi:beta-barrel assembly-enhancing protease
MVARKLQYAGALFDGRSSQKHRVDVELTPLEIILKIPGHDPIYWSYTRLHWAANTIRPFHIEHLVENEYGKCLETLVVDDPDFYENILNTAPKSFTTTAKGPVFNWKLYGAGILVLILFTVVSIKIIPSLFVDRMISKIPAEWEVAVGQSILNMLPVEQEPDPTVIAILQETVELLAKSVPGNPPYKLKVYILPIKKVNALALPGGPIIVYEGLLEKAESPEELAGVLAHEIQHVLLRHSTRGILRNMAEGFMVTLFLGDINAVMEGIVQLAGELETLGLSREMEEEADRKGMELILSANIDPHGMIRIFEKLMQEDSMHNEPPEIKADEKKEKFSSYLSTHPSGQSRLAQLEAQMNAHETKVWTPLFPNLDWNKIKSKN